MAIEGHSVGDDAYNQKFVGAPRAVGAAMAGCAQRVAADLDARLDAQDHAGALDAYIEAVKADRAARGPQNDPALCTTAVQPRAAAAGLPGDRDERARTGTRDRA